jgi:hypothetical protein
MLTRKLDDDDVRALAANVSSALIQGKPEIAGSVPRVPAAKIEAPIVDACGARACGCCAPPVEVSPLLPIDQSR